MLLIYPECQLIYKADMMLYDANNDRFLSLSKLLIGATV